MSTERITVALLARELGTKPNELMRVASDAGIRRTRVASTFSPAMASQGRRAFRASIEDRAVRRLSAQAFTPPIISSSRVKTSRAIAAVLTRAIHVVLPAQRHYYRQVENYAERRNDRLADHRRRLKNRVRLPCPDQVLLSSG